MIQLLTPNNLGGTWRRICSLDIRSVSALEVLRNRTLQIDIYLLCFVVYCRWNYCSTFIRVCLASFCATRNVNAVRSACDSWRRPCGHFFHDRTSDLSTCFISRQRCIGFVTITFTVCVVLDIKNELAGPNISTIKAKAGTFQKFSRSKPSPSRVEVPYSLVYSLGQFVTRPVSSDHHQIHWHWLSFLHPWRLL